LAPEEDDDPAIGTVIPLRSEYSEDLKLHLVNDVLHVIENMGLIYPTMQAVSSNRHIKVRMEDYLNKFPVRRHEGYWVDGGSQVAVFQPDSFLPFFLNKSGSRICRMCNCKNSVREIINDAKNRSKMPDKSVVERVTRFLLLLEELDLVEFRGCSTS